MISLDRDGAVRAMVGGRDYVNSSYNRATQANRQPGSSFKLFVYLTALESGYNPNSIVQDEPITINGWSPRNSNGRNLGPIPMRIAFAYSVNTVAARLAQQVGTSSVADMARRFGLTTRVETNPSMALGSNSVRLLDMTRAYASVARGVVAVTPMASAGDHRRRNLLYQHRTMRPGCWSALGGAADDRSCGRGRARHRPGRPARAGPPPAKPARPRRTRTGGSSAFERAHHRRVDGPRRQSDAAGPATAPARAFHDFMIRAVANRPPSLPVDAAPDWEDQPDNGIFFAPPDGPGSTPTAIRSTRAPTAIRRQGARAGRGDGARRRGSDAAATRPDRRPAISLRAAAIGRRPHRAGPMSGSTRTATPPTEVWDGFTHASSVSPPNPWIQEEAVIREG